MRTSFSIPEEYDLFFSPVPDSWHGGLYSGNGVTGVMCYADHTRELLCLQLGNAGYIDRRPEELRTGRVSYDSPRLLIGSLYLKAPGIRENSSLKLDLREAVVKGEINGKKFSLFTVREPSVIVVETELEYAFFEPEEAISPRYFICNDLPAGYKKNPPFLLKENSCTQMLLNGKSFTTAWKQEKNTLFIACDYGKRAEEILEKCTLDKVPFWKEAVRLSYRDFYEKSFLSIPDKALERFYYINLYKWHSATEKDNDFVLDLMGPWSKKTAWCAVWWNLNIQLTYQWLLTANRMEEMYPLVTMLADNLEQLRKNAKAEGGMAIGRASSYDCRSPVRNERGDLPWVCCILAEAFLHTENEKLFTLVKEILCGVLREYESLLYTSSDGVIHMKKTVPPEYGETQDAVFDLALLRKCIGYFLEFFKEDESKKEEISRYRFILENLVPYAADEDSYRMGKDLAFDHSHPHPNHLFMVYPMELPHDKTLAVKSIEKFLAMKEEHHGYSYTNTAGMFVRYGNGNKAEELLHTLLDWMKERHTENYMYHEYGSPVIETPFAFNSILQDMLLLSNREKIRLFPAVPDKWNEASFNKFHCVNNITVSAFYRKTAREIRIECTLSAEKDMQILLELPDKSFHKVSVEKGKETKLDFHLKK